MLNLCRVTKVKVFFLVLLYVFNFNLFELSATSSDWLKVPFLELDGETEPKRPVDAMMARAKRIYILIIKVDNLFSFFSSRCFLKEIENMYSVFLSSYRNTHESLGELEKVHSISRSPKLPLNRITVHVFYILNTI